MHWRPLFAKGNRVVDKICFVFYEIMCFTKYFVFCPIPIYSPWVFSSDELDTKLVLQAESEVLGTLYATLLEIHFQQLETPLRDYLIGPMFVKGKLLAVRQFKDDSCVAYNFSAKETRLECVRKLRLSDILLFQKNIPSPGHALREDLTSIPINI